MWWEPQKGSSFAQTQSENAPVWAALENQAADRQNPFPSHLSLLLMVQPQLSFICGLSPPMPQQTRDFINISNTNNLCCPCLDF